MNELITVFLFLSVDLNHQDAVVYDLYHFIPIKNATKYGSFQCHVTFF